MKASMVLWNSARKIKPQIIYVEDSKGAFFSQGDLPFNPTAPQAITPCHHHIFTTSPLHAAGCRKSVGDATAAATEEELEESAGKEEP